MKRLVLTCVVATALLAGCGSSKSSNAGGATTVAKPGATSAAGSGSSGSSSNADPCKLITQAEANKALSLTLDPAKKRSIGAMKSCYYGTIASGHVGDGVTVQVQATYVFDGSLNGAGANKSFDIVPISGLGDKAFVQSIKGSTSTIGILTAFEKGDSAYYIGVNSRSMTADQIKALEKTLAEKALSRL